MKPGGAIITLSVLAARNWWQVTWIRYRTLIAFLRATPQEWSGIRAHLLAKNRSFFGFIGSFLDRLGIFDNSLPQQMSRWRSSVYHLRTIPTAWSFVPRSLGFWNPIVVATDLRPTIRILFSSKSTNSPAHESKLEIQRFFSIGWHHSIYDCDWVKYKDQDNEMFSIICIYTESNSVVAAFTYIYRGDRQQSIL